MTNLRILYITRYFKHNLSERNGYGKIILGDQYSHRGAKPSLYTPMIMPTGAWCKMMLLL